MQQQILTQIKFPASPSEENPSANRGRKRGRFGTGSEWRRNKTPQLGREGMLQTLRKYRHKQPTATSTISPFPFLRTWRSCTGTYHDTSRRTPTLRRFAPCLAWRLEMVSSCKIRPSRHTTARLRTYHFTRGMLYTTNVQDTRSLVRGMNTLLLVVIKCDFDIFATDKVLQECSEYFSLGMFAS